MAGRPGAVAWRLGHGMIRQPIGRPMHHPATAEITSRCFSGQRLACRRGERLVFEALDFALPAGGALVLTGPNGSGKSSLLRLLAGLTPPAAGQLLWDGAPVAEEPAAHRARLHFIGHAEALKPALTAAENLAFWAGMRGGGAAGVQAGLERFRLERLGDWPCRLLSAGQRRRLALARLIANPAPLWLLDEPLTGLDEEAAADLFEAIEAHRQQGGRVVLSTHAPVAVADPDRLCLDDFRPTHGL